MEFKDQAKNVVAFAPQAVKEYTAEAGTKYAFTPEIPHENIRMCFVAVEDDFTIGKPYVFHRFANGVEVTYDPSQYGDFSATKFYFFTMLTCDPLPGGGDPYQVLIGSGDGEDGPAAELNYQFSSAQGTCDPLNSLNSSKDLVWLPGMEAEFVQGYYLRIGQKENMPWIQFNLSNYGPLQNNTVIHFIAGSSGIWVLGLLEKIKEETGHTQVSGCIDMGQLPADHNNINMLALVHPVSEGVNDQYVFQLGDPEKDGSITLRTV